METTHLLNGKKILAVDDEGDVLETLQDLLPMCEVETATTYAQAWEMLGTHYYDLAILDIMGVDGYRLLELAKERGISAVMLTAHAVSPEHIKRSYHGGAASYLPKDEMIHIEKYLADILEAKASGRSTWANWFDRLGAFFTARFGPEWEKKHNVFPDIYR